MARNLELRSTYLYNDAGIGTLSMKPEAALQDTSNSSIPSTSFSELSGLQKKNEYAVATILGKSIRDAMDSELTEIIEVHNSKKLTSGIRSGFKKSGPLSISDSKSSLEGFNFNSQNDFSKGEGTKYFIRKGAHKGHIILHIPAFTPVKALNAPENATNFKLSARLIALSDYLFNKEISSFVPMDTTTHGKYGKYESSMLPLLRIPTQPITAQISINRGAPLHDAMGTVLILAVKFYNYAGRRFTHLPGDGIMQILKVF